MRMLERAARAVAATSGIHYSGESIIDSANDDPALEHCVEVARAVLAAIADPGSAACQAAYDAADGNDAWEITNEDDWLETWRAALAAA